MAVFKTVAQITLSNIGGDLDTVHANGVEEQDIRDALFRLVSNGVFQTGDTITIEEVEMEVV